MARWDSPPPGDSQLETRTVQAPQPPSPHPSLAPVSPMSVVCQVGGGRRREGGVRHGHTKRQAGR